MTARCEARTRNATSSVTARRWIAARAHNPAESRKVTPSRSTTSSRTPVSSRASSSACSCGAEEESISPAVVTRAEASVVATLSVIRSLLGGSRVAVTCTSQSRTGPMGGDTASWTTHSPTLADQRLAVEPLRTTVRTRRFRRKPRCTTGWCPTGTGSGERGYWTRGETMADRWRHLGGRHGAGVPAAEPDPGRVHLHPGRDRRGGRGRRGRLGAALLLRGAGEGPSPQAGRQVGAHQGRPGTRPGALGGPSGPQGGEAVNPVDPAAPPPYRHRHAELLSAAKSLA